MPKYVRVRDKILGTHFDILDSRVNPDRHQRLSEKRWPPVLVPRRPKFRVTKGIRPSETSDAVSD